MLCCSAADQYFDDSDCDKRLSGLSAEQSVARSKSLVLDDAVSQVKGAMRKVLAVDELERAAVLQTTHVGDVDSGEQIAPASADVNRHDLYPSGSSNFYMACPNPSSVSEV